MLKLQITAKTTTTKPPKKLIKKFFVIMFFFFNDFDPDLFLFIFLLAFILRAE